MLIYRPGLAVHRNELYAGIFPHVLTRMRNQHQALSLLMLLAVSCVLTSCASPDKSAGKEEKEEPTAMTEAPLGSRIRKRTKIAPVSEATRQDVENARVQQGMQQTGAVIRAGGN